MKAKEPSLFDYLDKVGNWKRWIHTFGLVWFGLVSLFNGISTLCRLFNVKAILLEEQ